MDDEYTGNEELLQPLHQVPHHHLPLWNGERLVILGGRGEEGRPIPAYTKGCPRFARVRISELRSPSYLAKGGQVG